MEKQQALSFRKSAFTEADERELGKPKVFEWSPQQKDLFNWVRTGTGNALVIAVAGAGKTSSLLEAVKMMGGYVSIVAYNKKIADEIKYKVQKTEGQSLQTGTMHSFGLRAWRRVAPECKIEGFLKDGVDEKFQNAGYYKFDRIMDIINGTESLPMKWGPLLGRIHGTGFPFQYRGFVKHLLSLAKQYGVGILEPEDGPIWQWMVDRFAVDEDLEDFQGEYMDGGREHMIDTGIELARKALKVSNILSHEVIDFDDFIYMALSTQCRMFQVDFILADEAQDFSPTRTALCRKMLKSYGRAIFVADPCQSIYGYQGADADSVYKIRDQFQCTEIPLTVSFRCPQAVVREAQKYVSHIQSTDDAPEGSVDHINEEQFENATEFTHEDVILCRKNAPLVELAYKLIQKGIPCYVEGRDIGNGLLELSSKWKIVNLAPFKDKLEEYRRKQVAKLMAQKREGLADSLNDKVETLLAIIAGLPKGSTANDLRARISSLFQDSDGNRKKCLTLSSIHKWKGKESIRVFLYGMNIWTPSPFARQEWQKEQERNLIYVAITRAIETLIYVDLTRRK